MMLHSEDMHDGGLIILTLIYSLMVQTVTIFYFLAKNIGVEQQSFYVCLVR